MTHTCLFTSFGSNKLGWAGVFFLLKRQFVTLWNADILQRIQTNRNCMLATCMCVNNSCLSTFFLLLGVQTCQPWRACCIYASKIIRHLVLLFYIYGTLEMCTVSIWHAFLANISGKCHMQFGKKKKTKVDVLDRQEQTRPLGVADQSLLVLNTLVYLRLFKL